MRSFEFSDKVVEYLKEAKFEVKLIKGLELDLSVETVMSGSTTMM